MNKLARKILQILQNKSYFGTFSGLDLLVLFLLGIATFVTSFLAFRVVSPMIMDWSTYNYWFEGDSAIYFRMFTQRGFPQGATNRHPLLSLLIFPIVYIPRKIFNLGPELSMALFCACIATIWILLIYITIRSLGSTISDALLVSLLGLASAAAIFWLPVPETYAFGAITLLIPISLMAFAEKNGMPHDGWYIGAIALSLAVTTTNLMAGIVLAFCSFHWKKAVRLISVSIFIVVSLSVIQMIVFPTSRFFIGANSFDANYLFNPLALGVIPTIIVLLTSSMIMPEIHEVYGSYLSVQGVQPWSSGWLQTIGVCLWVGLLFLAIAQTIHKRRNLDAALILIMIGQLLVYTVFSQETFLYTLNLVTLMIVFVSKVFQSSFRRWLFLPAIALVMIMIWNNGARFKNASRFLTNRYSESYNFDSQVKLLTLPEDLIIFGDAPTLIGQSTSWRIKVSQSIDPQPTYLARFNRNGWILKGENWSLNSIRYLHQLGARYFVSFYSYGLNSESSFREFVRQKLHSYRTDPQLGDLRLG